REQEAVRTLSECIASWERMIPEAQEKDRSNYGKAQFQLGKIYLKSGRPFKARRNLQVAAKIDPKNQDVLYELGQCYLRLDLLDDAIQTLTTADRLKPGTDYVLDRLAQAHWQKGDLTVVEAIYQRIPDHRKRAFVLQHVGEFYLETGQHQKALQY